MFHRYAKVRWSRDVETRDSRDRKSRSKESTQRAKIFMTLKYIRQIQTVPKFNGRYRRFRVESRDCLRYLVHTIGLFLRVVVSKQKSLRPSLSPAYLFICHQQLMRQKVLIVNRQQFHLVSFCGATYRAPTAFAPLMKINFARNIADITAS